MKYYKLVVILLIALFTGCATRSHIPLNAPKIRNAPKIDSISAVELGDTVVKKYLATDINGVELLNSIQGGTIYGYFNPGFYEESLEDVDWTYYRNNERKEKYGALALKKDGTSGLMLASFATAVTYHTKPKGSVKYELKTKEVFSVKSFQQELIYTGKTGNNLKFLYRELSDNTLRFPFNQEIQYDLSESSIIGFKGSRIKVLEATNTKLVYQLLKNFP